MTIHLPMDLESSIYAAVRHGRFASVDAAMAEAARRLLRDLDQETPPFQPPILNQDTNSSGARLEEIETPDPILGIWRDNADEIDEIVADAYRKRQEPWRVIDL